MNTTTGTLDDFITLQDRIRIKLNDYGNKYVPITVSELARELKVNNYNVYQALYRLKNLGEIELEKEESEEGGRAKIIGINVIKLEPSGRTYHRAAERAKSEAAKVDSIEISSIESQMTALQEYLNQKLAILEMEDTARKAGLNPEDTVRFEPNEFAEEGLLLLKLLGDVSKQLKETKEKLQMTEFDLEAEKRNVEFLSRQKREDTRRDLIAGAPN
jgi:hypothetical protein